MNVYLVTLIILVVMLIMASSALAALYWAARDGQFDDMASGARSIFDAGEPVGHATDAFPARQPRALLTPSPKP
jgi:cbb3-type cytochrome oxidase maturation protein